MNQKLLKFSLICLSGAMVLGTNPKTAMAYEEAVAGFTYDKINTGTDNSTNNFTLTSFSNEIPMPGFDNIGIANVTTNLLIRSGPGEDNKILGKLPKDGICDILEADTGSGWTKIHSGSVTGYVKSEYLIIGLEASKLAQKIGNYVAVSNADGGLNVRKSPSLDSEILDQIASGEELLVIDSLVVTYGKEYSKWVKVSLDGDSENGEIGYVVKDFVNLSYSLVEALSLEEMDFGAGVSSLRMSIVNYAKQFLGNPYVWGGTSLNNGTDCSGFTMGVYNHYDYYLSRVSRDQAYNGTKISASSLKPGDLVFYGNNSTGYISHVAIYMGNGRIIHASNHRDGIKTSSLYYRQPVKCVRIIND